MTVLGTCTVAHVGRVARADKRYTEKGLFGSITVTNNRAALKAYLFILL